MDDKPVPSDKPPVIISKDPPIIVKDTPVVPPLNPLLELLPGDCILSYNNSWISKAIRFFRFDKNKTRVSHAAIVVGDGLIVESLWRIRVKEVVKYDGQGIIVYRIPDTLLGTRNLDMKSPMDIRKAVARHAMLFAGDSYGVMKIPLFALDSIFHTYWFTQKLGISSFKVCSELYAYCWQKFGNLNFNTDWRSASPDSLDDWFSVNGEMILSTL